MKLVICNATYLKSAPENPARLPEDDKIPVDVGDWIEIEKGCEYPKGHYQVKIDGKHWYCFKPFARIED